VRQKDAGVRVVVEGLVQVNPSAPGHVSPAAMVVQQTGYRHPKLALFLDTANEFSASFFGIECSHVFG
jgi:hypothetical protein